MISTNMISVQMKTQTVSSRTSSAVVTQLDELVSFYQEEFDSVGIKVKVTRSSVIEMLIKSKMDQVKNVAVVN